MDFYSILGFFPITLEDVFFTSPVTVGVRALCYPWAILGGACIVSALMSYTRGHVRVLFTVSAAIMTAFTAALARSTPDNAPYTIAMATLAAFGNGALVVPALTLALYAAPDNYIGTVGALSLSSRFLGGSVGTSVYFNVFNEKISKNLPALVEAAALKNNVPAKSILPLIEAMASPDYATLGAQVNGVTQAALSAAIYARQWAFADSLKYVWYTTIPFGVISTLCCLALPNIKQYMTNRVAVVSILSSSFRVPFGKCSLLIWLLGYPLNEIMLRSLGIGAVRLGWVSYVSSLVERGCWSLAREKLSNSRHFRPALVCLLSKKLEQVTTCSICPMYCDTVTQETTIKDVLSKSGQ